MTKKKYFQKEYDEEYYIFDSTTISEEKVNIESEYGYEVFSNAMMGDDVVDLLNEQVEVIKELEKEKEFWRYNCMHESSRNSILKFELELAQKQGYEWSDAFEEYEKSVKENSEWNKKYISEKGNSDVE